MELRTKTLKSKKTGKDFVAYCLAVGDFESPIFFPSRIELNYIKERLSSEDID